MLIDKRQNWIAYLLIKFIKNASLIDKLKTS